MRLLDLFCGAGGAAMGYHRAGFDEIVGVDIKPQPHYPFTFVQADALEYVAEHGREFDIIHASPPCQRYSVMTNGRWQDRAKSHADLIEPTRALLVNSDRPYIIENVSGARADLINPIMLCGSMFGLRTNAGNQLIRHRYFESPGLFTLTPTCQHDRGSAIGVYGGGQNPARKKAVSIYGHTGGRSTRDGEIGFSVIDRRDAMGIQWMTNAELSEAIPPAYTEWIGKQLIERVGVR